MSRSPQILTLRQAADRIGVHEQTMRKYIRGGLLRAFKTPSVSKFGGRFRITVADLEKFRLRQLTTAGPIDAPAIEGSTQIGNGGPRSQKNSQRDESRENLF